MEHVRLLDTNRLKGKTHPETRHDWHDNISWTVFFSSLYPSRHTMSPDGCVERWLALQPGKHGIYYLLHLIDAPSLFGLPRHYIFIRVNACTIYILYILHHIALLIWNGMSYLIYIFSYILRVIPRLMRISVSRFNKVITRLHWFYLESRIFASETAVYGHTKCSAGEKTRGQEVCWRGCKSNANGFGRARATSRKCAFPAKEWNEIGVANGLVVYENVYLIETNQIGRWKPS